MLHEAMDAGWGTEGSRGHSHLHSGHFFMELMFAFQTCLSPISHIPLSFGNKVLLCLANLGIGGLVHDGQLSSHGNLMVHD